MLIIRFKILFTDEIYLILDYVPSDLQIIGKDNKVGQVRFETYPRNKEQAHN